jgi:hypothetical protein
VRNGCQGKAKTKVDILLVFEIFWAVGLSRWIGLLESIQFNERFVNSANGGKGCQINFEPEKITNRAMKPD